MRILPVFISLVLSLACGSNPVGPQVLPIADLASAPSRVTVGGASLTLTPTLWRDFMPISPPDGKPLTGVLRIQTEDGSNVPAGVAADTAWVIRGSEIWATFVAPTPGRAAGPLLELPFTNGPKWGPHETVDVVVRLRDASGNIALLRAPQQMIGATQ